MYTNIVTSCYQEAIGDGANGDLEADAAQFMSWKKWLSNSAFAKVGIFLFRSSCSFSIPLLMQFLACIFWRVNTDTFVRYYQQMRVHSFAINILSLVLCRSTRAGLFSLPEQRFPGQNSSSWRGSSRITDGANNNIVNFGHNICLAEGPEQRGKFS